MAWQLVGNSVEVFPEASGPKLVLAVASMLLAPPDREGLPAIHLGNFCRGSSVGHVLRWVIVAIGFNLGHRNPVACFILSVSVFELYTEVVLSLFCRQRQLRRHCWPDIWMLYSTSRVGAAAKCGAVNSAMVVRIPIDVLGLVKVEFSKEQEPCIKLGTLFRKPICWMCTI